MYIPGGDNVCLAVGWAIGSLNSANLANKLGMAGPQGFVNSALVSLSLPLKKIDYM